MRLTAFILENQEEISSEWVKHAQDNISATEQMKLEEVRDHVLKILVRVMEDMETSQTDSEQEEKSKGNQKRSTEENRAARDHGEQRLESGFNFVQLSSEFRALRASVLRLWAKQSREENWKIDFHDMIRFNEAIDEAWTISLKRFQMKLDQSKNLFLGILGHDLRNPIATISGVNSILELSENLSKRERAALQYSKSGTKRMTELIENLLELTQLHLGRGMAVNKTKVDLKKQTEKIVQEMQVGYPETDIVLDSSGPIEGEWDKLRLEQMITNLMSNAIRHGEPGGTIKVCAAKAGSNGVFSVHNNGTPIPEKYKEKIFEGRFSRRNGGPSKEKGYGLGLYIVKEIVEAHQGEIELKSTQEDGTTFTVILPLESDIDNVSASVDVSEVD